MNFLGLIIAIATFLVIGIFHPIVIKSEYHFGTRCWWIFLIVGIAFIVASLFTTNDILWFPMNPKRKKEYQLNNNTKTNESN